MFSFLVGMMVLQATTVDNSIFDIFVKVVIAIVAPLLAAIFIKPNFPSWAKGLIGTACSLILAILQALYQHQFDNGADIYLVIIGIVIASHAFYEMFFKEIGPIIQQKVGIK